jgi:membrane-associated phospholipid phosphatase
LLEELSMFEFWVGARRSVLGICVGAAAFVSSLCLAPLVSPDSAAAQGVLVGTPEMGAFTLGSSGPAAASTATHTRPDSGGVLLDDLFRGGLRLGSEDARATAGTVSDILLLTLAAAPLLDNAFALASGGRSWGETGMNLAVDFGALGLAWGIVELIKSAVERDRPYVRECLNAGLGNCMESSSAQESFLSGHTTLAFTGAGLVCAHSANDDSNVTDVACAASLVLAAFTGGLRIMADAHYASDVLAGAALGLTIGFILPNVILSF